MDVPDDIREHAYKIAYRWAMPDEEALTKATAAIAEALMDERARCLRIVEERCEGDMDFAAFLIKRAEEKTDAKTE